MIKVLVSYNRNLAHNTTEGQDILANLLHKFCPSKNFTTQHKLAVGLPKSNILKYFFLEISTRHIGHSQNKTIFRRIILLLC